jgi:hypothetical protein
METLNQILPTNGMAAVIVQCGGNVQFPRTIVTGPYGIALIHRNPSRETALVRTVPSEN